MTAAPIGHVNAAPISYGLSNAAPPSCGEVDSALARIDEKIGLLAIYSAQIAEIANALCSSYGVQGETGGVYPQPVATGVREKLDERERRLSTILESIAPNIERLRAL